MKFRRWSPLVTSFVLGAVLLAGAPEAAFARIFLSAPLAIPAYSQDLDHTEASLAVLEDGSFAVSRLADEGLEVIFFKADATAIRRRVIPLPPGTTPPLSGGIGAFGDRYFLSWSRRPSGLAHACFYSREGDRLGKIFPWPFSDMVRQYQFLRYAPGPTGRVLPFFRFEDGIDRLGRPGFSVRSQLFGPVGFWGAPVEHGPDFELDVVDAAINENGRFVVLFKRCPKGGSLFGDGCKLGSQVFDRAWRPRSPLREEFFPRPSAFSRLFTVALSRSGSHVVAWVKTNALPSAEDARLRARLFQSDGLPAGEALQVNETGLGQVGGLKLRATPQAGTFVVAWLNSPTGFGLDAYIREFDAKTGRLGEQLLIARDIDASAWDFQINSSGHGVVMLGNRVILVTVVPDEEIHNEE